MCYGYCSTELEVEPQEATLRDSTWSEDKSICPDLKVRAYLSDRHWKELEHLIDRESLFSLPDRVGCPGCVDEPIQSVEIRFSNHTNKAIYYNYGDAPQEIRSLSAKLEALHDKLKKELHPITQCAH